MKILAIETSCDETGAAVLNFTKNEIQILSNIVATSLALHSKTGGIIPENAAREQLKYIIPVINKSLLEANITESQIDKIAVTVGPGLIGSLLVGVQTAKTYSYILNKPLIAINHLYGHIFANFIGKKLDVIKFPAIALVVSGGHTDLVLMKDERNMNWLGGTRDDAAGEALDKTGRLLGLPYPAGPKIEELAKAGQDNFRFPRPLIDSKDYDFSFSGLKTAVLREVQKIGKLNDQKVSNLCCSIQQAIIDILKKKTLKAAKEYNAKSILIGGGVAANSTLREQLKQGINNELPKIELYIPERKFCTDNAAMIGAAALFNKETKWQDLNANPELYFD